MSRKIYLLILLSLSLSCTKEELLNQMTEQEKLIEKYTSTLQSEEVVINDGVWRAVLEEGSGSYSAKAGDSVIFNYSAYIFSNGKGKVFDTNIKSVAKEAGLGMDQVFLKPRAKVVGRGELLPGLDRGLIGVKKGEKCYLIFSSRHGFGNKQIGMVPKMSPLIYEVWIVDVKQN